MGVCMCVCFKVMSQTLSQWYISNIWIWMKVYDLLQGICCLTICRSTALYASLSPEGPNTTILSTSKFLWVLTVQTAVVAKSSFPLLVLCLFSQSSWFCNYSFSLIHHSLSWSWLHYLPIFVMVHWYITNTIKPLMILQLLANTSQLQGWKISDITSDITSFPFIGSVRTNAVVPH